MRRLPIAGVLVLLATIAVPAIAQKPTAKSADNKAAPPQKTLSPGEIAATPEMWFYQQYQQQDQNPASMVYQRAKNTAAQRTNRLAAMRWYGFSNLRPQSSVDLINGDGSPGWTSTNLLYPNRWAGSNCTQIVILK